MDWFGFSSQQGFPPFPLRPTALRLGMPSRVALTSPSLKLMLESEEMLRLAWMACAFVLKETVGKFRICVPS